MDFEEENGAGPGGPGNTASTGQGGSTNTSSGGNGAGGGVLPCGIDCSTIQAPQCGLAQCNTTTLQCEIVDAPDGDTCDDGVFCTSDDTCLAGVCMAGPPNTCGMMPAACQSVTCNETNQTCSFASLTNGTACQSANLCMSGTTCTNGLCTGGTPTDCFFFPVPDACHVAECNPMNGLCHAVVGNNGGPCTDATDLCTVNKTCAMGTCQGGTPKDCSALSSGCNVGVCNTSNGNCVAMAVMNGQPCNDLNPCTTGEVCNNSQCVNGVPVTQCLNNDGCCPMGCNQNNDSDCNCNTNHALVATAAVNPGGGSTPPYDPARMNNGVGENCNEWAWMDNDTVTPGWASLTWTNTVTIASMFIDSEHATAPACNVNGRDIASAQVQYMDVNNNWITSGTISGQENYWFVFPSPVIAKAVRLWNVLSSPGNGNTIVHEWYVYTGTNCPTPMPN